MKIQSALALGRFLVVSAFAACTSLAAVSSAAAAGKDAQPQVQASALKQIETLRQIKKSKTPAQNKIDSRLYMGMLKRRSETQRSSAAASRLAPLTDFRFIRPGLDGRVPVQIAVRNAGDVTKVWAKLNTLGAVINSSKRASARFKSISARVRLEDLEALAALAEVRKVRQAIPARTNKINTSEGDATHGADDARGIYGTTGTGVKVCVLSDGVDSLADSQASGDLPAVDVLPGQDGNGDEGTAMLEIVHDLAPGADLGFATAFTDEASFAQNILDLAADGCNIIVDDVIYLDESPFQDGPVAQSVNTVTAGGVIYFSSAGNEGNANDLTSGTWEGDFLASGAADPAPLTGANLHNFGDGGNSILVEFGVGEDTPPLLIWAEHYDLAIGKASTDFDIYVMNADLTSILDASIDVQDGAGDDDFPIEFVGDGTFSGERLLIDKFAAGSTSSQPMMNLIVFRGELDDALATSGATRGHSAATDAFSVAATPAADSFDGITANGPFPGPFTSANESESFTSDGLRRIILSPTGVELTPGNRTNTGGEVRAKPDITAADGVRTSAPGFDPFYGTSAAAPHAAAIAALLKSALALTPAEIRGYLVTSAVDIESPNFDRDTGNGIVMPGAALAAAGAAPQAFLESGTVVYTKVLGDGDAFIEPNERWSITVPLKDISSVGATAVSGVLSTATANVTIVTANSAYPNLAGGATGNNVTKYVFDIGPAFPCGGTIDFTLTASYTGGTFSPQAFDFATITGGAGAAKTFNFTGPAVPIPDGLDISGGNPGAPAFASVLVSGVVGNVKDVNLRIGGTSCNATAGSTTVGVDHSWVNDLELTLISPSATSVKVIDHIDGSANNICQTLLDDETAGDSIQGVSSIDAPFTGSFTPAAPLSGFDGVVANGTWQFRAQDFFAADTGNIRAYSLILTPAVCDAIPKASFTLAAQNHAESGAFTATVKLSGSTTSAVTVPFTTTGGTASNPADFSVSTISPLVFNPGTTSLTINGTITPDALDELDETVKLTLGAPTNATLGSPAVHTLTIVDDDLSPRVTMIPLNQTVGEGVGTASIIFQLDALSGLPITVPLTYGGTAAAPSDYIAGPSSITIPAGSISSNLVLTIVNNAVHETTEVIQIGAGGAAADRRAAPTKGTITITDND